MRAPGDGAVRRIVAAAWPRRTSAAQPRGPGQQTLSQRRSPRTTQAKSLLRAGLGDDHGFGRLLPDNASERHERDGVVEQSTSTDPGSSRFNACPSHPAPEAGVGSGDDPGVSAARAAASTADSDAAKKSSKTLSRVVLVHSRGSGSPARMHYNLYEWGMGSVRHSYVCIHYLEGTKW